MALRTTAADIGLGVDDLEVAVWGAVMDMAFPEGTATLVAFAEGSASLYTSGASFIGAGEYEVVAQAAVDWLATVDALVEHFDAPVDDALPPPGVIHLRARTFDGDRLAVADEEDLGEGRHPLSPAFYAAHELIARIREHADG